MTRDPDPGPAAFAIGSVAAPMTANADSRQLGLIPSAAPVTKPAALQCRPGVKDSTGIGTFG
jgi:hypothetical protein